MSHFLGFRTKCLLELRTSISEDASGSRKVQAGVEPVLQTHGSGSHPEGRTAKQSMPLLHGGTGAGRGTKRAGMVRNRNSEVHPLLFGVA